MSNRKIYKSLRIYVLRSRENVVYIGFMSVVFESSVVRVTHRRSRKSMLQKPDLSQMTRAEREMYDKLRDRFGSRFFTRHQAFKVDQALANVVGARLPDGAKKGGEVIQPFLEKWFMRASGGRPNVTRWMFYREKPLTWLDVEHIRAEAAKGAGFKELAEKYQVPLHTSRNIIERKTWTGAQKTGRPKGSKDTVPRRVARTPMIREAMAW